MVGGIGCVEGKKVMCIFRMCILTLSIRVGKLLQNTLFVALKPIGTASTAHGVNTCRNIAVLLIAVPSRQ